LHGQVLTAIEENFSERIDEFTERLADHAVRGEVWDKAAAYCCKAGQRANGLSAHRAARTFFERALDAAGRLPMSRRVVQQAIEIRLGLRVSLVASADLELVRKYLQEAESLARSIDDERRLMPIVISRSTILNNLGDLQGAVEAGLHGRALAERMNDEASFISSGFALGQAYWNRGDFAKAEDILSATVQTLTADLRKRYAGTTGTASVLCLVSLSHTHCLVGNWQQAFARSREALEIAMETEKPYDLSYAHGAQGLAHLTVGEFEAAIRHLEEALRIAQAAEIMLLVPHAARYLGRAYALTGRLDEASTLLSGAVDQAKSQSLAALHGWCAAALGLTRLLSGASGEAERLVRGALDFARGQEYRPLEVHISRLLGVISTQASSDAAAATRAERWFRGAITLAAELGMQPEQAHCHDGLADLLARTGRLPEARGELAQALELYRASGVQRDAARIAVALAGVGGEVPLPAPATPTGAVGRRIA
jgi:tetratricopeptide (TPR) repeat protein